MQPVLSATHPRMTVKPEGPAGARLPSKLILVSLHNGPTALPGLCEHYRTVKRPE